MSFEWLWMLTSYSHYFLTYSLQASENHFSPARTTSGHAPPTESRAAQLVRLKCNAYDVWVHTPSTAVADVSIASITRRNTVLYVA